MKTFKISDLKQEFSCVLIYGTPGQGKTTALGLLKGKTLIIDIDKGTSVLKGSTADIDVVRIDIELAELPKILDELEKKCEYNNVCIDSISELEKTMLTVYGRLGKNDGAPELSHYNKVQFKLVDYCRRFRNLKANLIMTAWETLVEYIAPDGSKYTQSKPMLSGKTADTIMGLCDVVGRLEISSKEETKGKRYLRLEASPVVTAKDRLHKRSYCEIQEVL